MEIRPSSPLYPHTTPSRSLAGGVGTVPVALHDVVAADDDLPHLAGRDVVARAVDQPHLHALDGPADRSEEHTSELQSRQYLVCRLLLEKNYINITLLYNN